MNHPQPNSCKPFDLVQLPLCAPVPLYLCLGRGGDNTSDSQGLNLVKERQALGAVGACCRLWVLAAGCAAAGRVQGPGPWYARVPLFVAVTEPSLNSCHFTSSVPANSILNPGLCLPFWQSTQISWTLCRVSQGSCAVPPCI